MKKNILVTGITLFSVLFTGISSPKEQLDANESLLFMHIRTELVQTTAEEFPADMSGEMMQTTAIAGYADARKPSCSFHTCGNNRETKVTIAQ
ncbi:MAG: hypothetical protein ACO1NW_02980 [Chitinophagaceae bacterium]